MPTLRIGTRGSRLALAQAEWVATALASSGIRPTLVEITTSGDRIRDVPLGPHLGSSFFTKEIESALLAGRIDVAVHSCKDLATRMPDGLSIASVPEREDPRDVVVARPGRNLEAEGAEIRVGTSSPRRQGLLAALRPDWTVVEQRGNVPTRVSAVDDGTLDGAVLAAAGLARLDMLDRATVIFDPSVFVPAAAQGALALQCRSNDVAAFDALMPLDHEVSHAAVRAERAVLRTLQAGCQAPIGAHATVAAPSTSTTDASGLRLTLTSVVVTPDGLVRARRSAALTDPETLGREVAADISATLGVETLAEAPRAGVPARGSAR